MLEQFEFIDSRKQTREKRACDNCANLKLKCTFQVPCDHCSRKSLTCLYTRNGYLDPYERFRVDAEKDNQESSQQLIPTPASPQPAADTCSFEQRAAQSDNATFQSPSTDFDFSILDLGLLNYPSTPYSDWDAGGWLGNVPHTADFGLPAPLDFTPALDTNVPSNTSPSLFPITQERALFGTTRERMDPDILLTVLC
jgi:hypothetical protein